MKLVGVDADSKSAVSPEDQCFKYNFPEWDYTATFHVTMTEFVYLIITIGYHNDQTMGNYVLPLKCLREGIRAIPLYNTEQSSVNGHYCVISHHHNQSSQNNSHNVCGGDLIPHSTLLASFNWL